MARKKTPSKKAGNRSSQDCERYYTYPRKLFIDDNEVELLGEGWDHGKFFYTDGVVIRCHGLSRGEEGIGYLVTKITVKEECAAGERVGSAADESNPSISLKDRIRNVLSMDYAKLARLPSPSPAPLDSLLQDDLNHPQFPGTLECDLHFECKGHPKKKECDCLIDLSPLMVPDLLLVPFLGTSESHLISGKQKDHPGIKRIEDGWAIVQEHAADVWDFVDYAEYHGECVEECYRGKYGLVLGDLTLLLRVEGGQCDQVIECWSSCKSISITEKFRGSSGCWLALEVDGSDAGKGLNPVYDVVCRFVKTPACIQARYGQIIARRRRRESAVKSGRKRSALAGKKKKPHLEHLNRFAEFYREYSNLREEKKRLKSWHPFVQECFLKRDGLEVDGPKLYRWRREAIDLVLVEKEDP